MPSSNLGSTSASVLSASHSTSTSTSITNTNITPQPNPSFDPTYHVPAKPIPTPPSSSLARQPAFLSSSGLVHTLGSGFGGGGSKVERAEAKYDVTVDYPNLELHSAAASGDVGLVSYALTHGQPVNSLLHGVLPLHAACSSGSEQIVRMLIDRGADVNAPRLPRRYAESLHAAQKQMQKERDNGGGAGDMMASGSGSATASGSTSLADRARQTLHLGGHRSHSSSSTSAQGPNLLTRMTRRPPPLVIVGQAGSTPLHFAAANGHVPIVRILLACGAIHDKADKHGHTPQMLAEANGHEEVVETLKAWEGLVEREREKMRAKTEEKEQEDVVASEAPEPEATGSTSTSTSRWSKKDRATSHGSGETAQKAHLRHSLENMFQSKRRNSLRARKSTLQMTAGEAGMDAGSEPPLDDGHGTVDTVEANLPGSDRRRSTEGSSSRRPSLPSIFEKAGKGHLGFRRSSLRRQSHAASMAAPTVDPSSRPGSFSSDFPAELNSFRGRLTSHGSEYSEAQDSNSSIHSTARHMSRTALLTLFRKDPYGTPPSPSPSPPRSAPTPLLPEDIDESVERIKRVSMDGARSSTGSVATRPSSSEPGNTGRKRSASQVTFSDSVHSVGTTASGYPWSGPTPLSAPPTTTTFDAAEGDGQNSDREADEEDKPLRPNTTRARSQSNPSDDLYPAPLSRSGSEVFVPSPLGQDWSKGDAPKSILRKRTNSPGRLTMRSLPSTPVTKGKKRSATMPESIPFALMDGLKDVERQRQHGREHGQESSPDHDKHQGEKQDQVGESIWDRAAARRYRKSKSRNGSFGSISSIPVPSSPTASSDLAAGSTSRLYTQRQSGPRARNRSVSSVSTTASGMNFSTSTYDTNFTPFTPISQTATFDQSELDPASVHVKKGMARRLSKRKEKNPALLYDVPIPAPKGKPVAADSDKVAADRVRHAEQDILQSLAIGSSSSLAEQLAAYGDSLLLQKQASRSNGTTEAASLAPTSSDQVSRSYATPSSTLASNATRPQITKSDSSDSNATLKTQDSRPRRVIAPVEQATSTSGPPPPPPVVRAPSASIPAINRIYEDRAAAYRKKGLALKQKAPMYAASKSPVDIKDHWLMAGAPRRSSSGTVSPAAGEPSEIATAKRRPRISDDDSGDHDQPRSRSTSGGSVGTASPVIATTPSPHSMRQRWGDLNFKSATKNFIGKHRA